VTNRAAVILTALGSALLAIILVRLTSATSTLPYWETDPAFGLVPETTITPAMSLALDALAWLLCAAIFALMSFAKRRVHTWQVAAAMLGAGVAILHGFSSLGTVAHPQDLIRGSLWASSMISAVTLAHLAGDRPFRQLCFACLGGVAVYMSAKGAFQVLVEHPRYIQHFDSEKDSILSAMGITPGSPQALIFERRVRQPEATGWGGLSNSFGTVVATGALAWLALTLVARKHFDKDRQGLLGLFVIAGLASLAGLWFSQSRGAMAVLLVVAIAIPIARWLPRTVGRSALIALPGLAILGVIAQGFLGPALGDLSIYFRSQYWQGAAGIFAENPIFGVGAGSFKDAFLLHRPPTCPEEVVSPHSIFIDWLAALGIFAIPWIWITLTSLWRAGAALVRADDAQPDRPENTLPGGTGVPPVRTPDTSTNHTAFVLIALTVFAWGAWLEWQTLFADEIFVRALGILLWIGAGFVFFKVAPKITARNESLLWALMAAMVIVHSQIEMTAVMPTTAMWALGVVFVAGAQRHQAATARRWPGIAGSIVAVAACAMSTYWCAGEIDRERSLRRAADRARDVASSAVESEIDAFSQIDRLQAILSLLAEANTTGVYHAAIDQRIAEYHIGRGQYFRLIGKNGEAAQSLVDARSALLLAAMRSNTATAFGRAGSFLASNASSTDSWIEAFSVWDNAAKLDPWGLEPAMAIHQITRQLNDTAAARAAAIRLLEIDDAKYLDPLRQLPADERKAVEAFLQETAPASKKTRIPNQSE